MSNNQEQQLVLSAIGEDRPGLVTRLSDLIKNHGGNILDSRMTVLGGEFAILMQISAPWNALAKLEDNLPTLEHELGLTIISKRTEDKKVIQNAMPYHVEVVSLDHPGIVHQITSFFSNQGINIQDLSTSRYQAAHTGAPLFSLNMIINVPAGKPLVSLREQFFMLCDEHNLDVIIEPVKI
ncbi:MAG: glycine cleavage system protein R [Gammaproteobacteria bacterium]|nr:glycine cleavage system protein R [Gammaproteobacteria bacterium]